MSLWLLIFIALFTTASCNTNVSVLYDYCDPKLKLCPVPSMHTMCLYPVPGLSKHCTPNVNEPLTEVEKINIISWHNNLRSSVATGTESSVRSFPPASNMMQMYWDHELESIARRWVEQCVNITTAKIHDECRNTKRFTVTQNVGTIGTKGIATEKQILHVFYRWYTKIKSFDLNAIDNYVPSEDNEKVEEFTNLIWADTYAIGCARVISYDNITESQGQNGNTALWTFERIVCNYGPGGNIPGHPIYRRGAKCSNCPTGSSCSKEYDGLCALEDIPISTTSISTGAAPTMISTKYLTSIKNSSSSQPIFMRTSPEVISNSSPEKNFMWASTVVSPELNTKAITMRNNITQIPATGGMTQIETSHQTHVSSMNSSSFTTQVYDNDTSNGKISLTAGIYLNGMCHCPDISRFGFSPRTYVGNGSEVHSRRMFWTVNNIRNASGILKSRKTRESLRNGDRCYCIKTTSKGSHLFDPPMFFFLALTFYVAPYLIYFIQ